MKKGMAIAAAIICCVGMLAGCGGGKSEAPASGAELKEGQSLQKIVDQIDAEVGIAMPSEIDENFLQDMCYIPIDDVEEVAGKIAIVNTSADNVIAVKVQEGAIDTAKAGLEKRLADVQASFAQYLPEQYEKAQKGKVLVKGNYAFLLLVGQSGESCAADIEKAEEIVNAAFA